jgi:glycosyltransferase involved in cell wall biosynthesis
VPSTLIVSGCEGMGAERYRVFHRRELLELAGQVCTVVGYSQLENRLDSRRAIQGLVEPADIIIFHRTPHSDLIADMLGAISAQGKPAVFDVDDLVFEPGMTRFHRGVEVLTPAEKELYHSGVRRCLQMVTSCDYFIGATDYLAELARGHSCVAYVDRNSLSLRFLSEAADARRRSRRSPDTVVIGYSSGTHTHNHDFLEAADALVEVLRAYPQVRLSIVGPLDLDARFAAFGDRIEKIPMVDWERVPHIIAGWDINLAPLEIDNPFCRCKSELKYFEAGILGVPTVASKIEPFEHAIDDGKNGFLCRSKDDWCRALRLLIEEPAVRARIGQQAEEHTITNYTPLQRAPGLVRLLESIIEHHHRRPANSISVPAPKNGLEIGWVVPTPAAGSGGHMTILRNVRFLQQFGHRSTLYIDGGGRFSDPDQLAWFLRDAFIDTGANVRIGFDEIANCDVLIATHWSTVHVVQTNGGRARKVYFVQDFEPCFVPMNAEWIEAEQTYRLGLRCVTIGRWLTHLLRLRYDADADYIDFAVDTSTYHPRALPESDPPIVCAVFQPEKPRRGNELMAKALERLHRLCPEARIVLFGSNQIPDHLPFPFENARLLPVNECAQLYSRAAVGVILSLSNPSLIGFEMMACGCAVVDVDLENNHFDYGKSGNPVLARPEPDALAAAIAGLLNDSERRREIARAGREFILGRSYEASARRFEQHLLRTWPERQGTLARDVFQLRHDGATPELVGGLELAQSFRCAQNLLCAVELFVTTFGRAGETRLTLSLRRATPDGEELARVTIPTTALRDNDWARFSFDPVLVSEGKTFVVRIRSDDAVPGQGVFVYRDSTRSIADGQLWVAGRAQTGALKFRTYYVTRTDLLPVRRSAEARPPESLPLLAADLGPGIPTSRNDLKVSQILRTIQRINKDKIEQARQLQHIIHEKETHIHYLQAHIAAMAGSRSWRAIHRVRGVLRRVKRTLLARAGSPKRS